MHRSHHLPCPAGPAGQRLRRPADLRAPIASALGRHGGRTLPAMLLATLLLSLLGLALPVALLQVYDRILPQAATGTLGLIALAVAAAVLLELALRIVRGDVLARLAAAAEADAHAAAAARIAGMPSTSFEARGNGWYSERLAAIGSLREAWSGPALQAILDLPFALLYLLAIWMIAGPLALVPLGLLGGVALLGWGVGRRTRHHAERLAAAEERRFNFLFDVLRGLQSLKLLGAERLLERRYERLQDATAELRRTLATAGAAAQEGGLFLAHLATIATAGFGCLLVLDGALTIGGLGACTMLVGRSMQPLLGGVALWARWQALGEQKRRLAELADLPAEARPMLRPLVLREGRISLQGVRFGARPDGRFLFEGLSLDVAPGALVGLVGPNGCGRSALLRLIAGAAQPLAGSVRLDGQNLAVFDAVPARGAIALVTTDVALIGGTLLDNLTLRQPEAEPQVLALATEFGLDLVAAALPGGWHTPVGSGAVPLSRGICQRIGLVRALAQQPRILLLDDVTAQLDADGDARLGRMLVRLRGRTTTLLVSHRRSVLELADRVLRFKDGRLEPVA